MNAKKNFQKNAITGDELCVYSYAIEIKNITQFSNSKHHYLLTHHSLSVDFLIKNDTPLTHMLSQTVLLSRYNSNRLIVLFIFVSKAEVHSERLFISDD